ncbi:hypothetical protein, partial [Leptospira bouyouniensis]|uniref:hypothetical protein n=1 Tax=Leptospira bouyouniensis TaxID=2484911 RepID=UPI001AEFFC40
YFVLFGGQRRTTLMLELEAHASSRVLAVAAVPLGAPQAFPHSWLKRINRGWRKEKDRTFVV